jgi:transposase
VQGVPVTLRVRVGRWRCQGQDCPQKIFAERIPEMTMPYTQRTGRTNDVVHLVGYRLGGRPAERLMQRLGMNLSDDTFLRAMKRKGKMVRPPKPLRVIGIDDWAWKKGQPYGTIVVDLEHRQVADLLPERSAHQVAQWLKPHTSIQVVRRDRFGLYSQGARVGAPQARQVADRFHLLLNLRKAVEQELS